MNETCVKFVDAAVEQPPHGHHIHITSRLSNLSCFSWLGFRPSERGVAQPVNIGSIGCFDDMGTSEHELLHVLGLDHEHNRPDRDDFILIVSDKVKPGNEKIILH